MTLLDEQVEATPPEVPEPVVGERMVGDPALAETPEPAVALVALAAFLATSSAAWMAGGLIRGAWAPRLLALVGAVIGVGAVALATRLRSTALHYAAIPVAAIVGAAVIAPDAGGGTANLPNLVGEALTGGGLLQPPIPFDPGWKFLLVVTFAVVGAAAAGAALSRERSRLAVVVPLPLAAGAALLQPPGNEVVASVVGMLLLVAAVAVAYGADLTRTGSLGAGFELRRLGSGAVILAGITAGLVLLAQTDFLFPSTDDDRVVPPQKPPTAPLEKDRELARVKATSKGPWRVGVIDVYDGEAWLLPPVDPKRIKPLDGGRVPRAVDDGAGVPVEFTLVDMRGRSLPVPGGLVRIDGRGADAEYDPRTGVPVLERRVPRGFTYTAVMAPLPTGTALNASPRPDESVAAEFAAMPTAPAAVIDLLAQAPGLETPFDRLQFLRDRLYANVIAVGEGTPVDVSPERAAELLRPNAEASPYEITATEAMLARWAGLPARIGYGYYGGSPIPDGFSIHPEHGAAWLEVYFEGMGWVPLVGTPPKAKSSFSENQKNENPRVTPSTELALTVFIPVRRTSLLQLFQVVRYWLFVLTPLALLTLGFVLSIPAVVKAVRSSRRHRWALAHGPVARVAVAYSELRDRCHDLNLGDPRDTPLEFVARFEPDEQHAELAWLVTRVVWGDLRRDVRDEDAASAEGLATSVGRRIGQAQSTSNRVLGRVSRASLRDPFTDDVPNIWPRLRLPTLLGRGRRRRLVPTTAVLVVVVALLFGGCAKQGGFTGAEVPASLPERVAPDSLFGFVFHREAEAEKEFETAGDDALVTGGQIYTLRRADIIQGSMQVSVFRPDLDANDLDVQRQVEQSFGGTFENRRLGPVRLRVQSAPDRVVYLWFPPERNTMVLFVMRSEFTAAEDLVTATVAWQRGLDPARILTASEARGVETSGLPEPPDVNAGLDRPATFPVVDPQEPQ